MLKPQNESDSLLKARLKNDTAQKPPSSPTKSAPQKSQSVSKRLRPKAADNDNPIPTYATESKPSTFSPIADSEQVSLGRVDSSTKKHTRSKPKKGLLPESKVAPKSAHANNTESSQKAPVPERAVSQPQPLQSAEEFDREIDFTSAKEAKKQQRASFLRVRLSKFIVGIMVILCVYIAFLTYGLIQTSYIYDDTGNVTAEILSVEDLRVLGQYEELSGYYLRTRILYEEVLKLDYELAMNGENSRAIAREYLALLDTVSKLSTDLSANELDIAYAGIINQIYELVYTHIAVYLQNMSGAITENNANKANQALQGREVINQYFTTLTANMADLCHTTHGAKNGDIYNWSPDSYMASLGGMN